ncbi:MAG: Ig-like domain-containing protein [Mycobacteriaceae bacterium]
MSPTTPVTRWTRRAALAVLGGAVGTVAVAACSPGSGSSRNGSQGGGKGGGQGSAPSTEAAPTTTVAPKPTVEISFAPTAGATDFSVLTPAKVTTAKGTLTKIVLTNPDGKAVAGQLDPSATEWVSNEVLGYGKTYTWSGTAMGFDGLTAPVQGSFTTVTPKSVTSGVLNAAIGDGAEVGVATSIILQFNGAVTNRAQVEKALVVKTTPATEGAWAWLPDSGSGARAHWRTKNYWAAGTQVEVTAPIYGMDLGNGHYGASDASSRFSIGRNQVVKGYVPDCHITVERDGQQVARYPVSFGKADLDRNVTRTGVHVVNNKLENVLMTNLAAGYKDVKEKWAVRISNNGEFIHANPETVSVQGIRNVSNGCVNMSDANAQQYFHTAIYGDPVEITGTRIPLSAADGDLYDWALDWKTWKSMSALG